MAEDAGGRDKRHKDNLRHLSRFPDFFVTKRILTTGERVLGSGGGIGEKVIGREERREEERMIGELGRGIICIQPTPSHPYLPPSNLPPTMAAVRLTVLR